MRATPNKIARMPSLKTIVFVMLCGVGLEGVWFAARNRYAGYRGGLACLMLIHMYVCVIR